VVEEEERSRTWWASAGGVSFWASWTRFSRSARVRDRVRVVGGFGSWTSSMDWLKKGSLSSRIVLGCGGGGGGGVR